MMHFSIRRLAETEATSRGPSGSVRRDPGASSQERGCTVVRDALRAVQTATPSRCPSDNQEPRGCRGRSSRRSAERVCSHGGLRGQMQFRNLDHEHYSELALMILRKKRGSQEVAIGGNHEFGSDNLCCQRADHAPNPEACCAQNETKRILRAGIAGLRPNLKVVVEIHLQGRSMPETAEALGISLSAAKGRLFHARKALRRSAVLRTTNRKLRY